MAICPKCQKRKAKRRCPALGSAICQLCCGRHREKDIHCPPTCAHLSAHKPYQEKKIIDKRPEASGNSGKDAVSPPTDERSAWLAFHIENRIREYAAAHPDFSDRETILALEYTLEKVEEGQAQIILPGAPLKPRNAAGEAILEAVEACRYQTSVILTTGTEAYKTAEKIAVLRRIQSTVKQSAGTHTEGQKYLQDLGERFARLGARAGDKKILTFG